MGLRIDIAEIFRPELRDLNDLRRPFRLPTGLRAFKFTLLVIPFHWYRQALWHMRYPCDNTRHERRVSHIHDRDQIHEPTLIRSWILALTLPYYVKTLWPSLNINHSLWLLDKASFRHELVWLVSANISNLCCVPSYIRVRDIRRPSFVSI